MKIVKHGILAPLPIRFECPKCECEFVAEGDEYRFTGLENDIARCDCPECGCTCSLYYERGTDE